MTLNLTLEEPAAPFTADGPMPLVVTLHNGSSRPVPAPKIGQVTDFLYTVLSRDGSATLLSASARANQMMRSPGLIPRLPPVMTPLLPGTSVTYSEDLASYLAQPVSPGEYLLEVSWAGPGNRVLTTQRVPFAVRVSRPQTIAQTLDSKRSCLILAEFHAEAEGSVLRKRESGDGGLLGRFYDLQRLAARSRVQSACIAVEAGDRPPAYWRWIAWMDGSTLHAGVARAVDLRYATGAIDTALEDAVLFPSGYGFDDARALFVLLGNHSGKRTIRLVTISPYPDELPQWRDVRISVPPDVVPRCTFVQLSDGQAALQFTWLLHTESESRVTQQLIEPTTGEVLGAPATVFATHRAVEALEVPVIASEGAPDSMQILLRPDEPDGGFTWVCGKAERLVPPIPQNLSIRTWVLPSHCSDGAPLMAIAGDIWWVRHGDAWAYMQASNVVAGTVRLWALASGHYWCTWFDSVRGYQSKRIA